MPPEAVCAEFGVPNCLRVVMNGKPEPPFDAEAAKLDRLDRVVWSLIGDGGSGRSNQDTDMEEILRLAPKHPNMVAAVMDDFMNEKRMKLFPPERLAGFRAALHAAPDRALELWTVLYTHELDEKMLSWLKEIDRVTLWTWRAADLADVEKNFETYRRLTEKDPRPVMAGCYLYDYGDAKPISDADMARQLDVYGKWLTDGSIEGIIFCSNTIADIGLSSVDVLRRWIRENGETEL